MDIDLNIGFLTVNPDKSVKAEPTGGDEIPLPEIDFTTLIGNADKQKPLHDPDAPLPDAPSLTPDPANAPEEASEASEPEIETGAINLIANIPLAAPQKAAPVSEPLNPAPIAPVNQMPAAALQTSLFQAGPMPATAARPIAETPAPDQPARATVDIQPAAAQPLPAAQPVVAPPRNAVLSAAPVVQGTATPAPVSEPEEPPANADLRPVPRSDQPQPAAVAKSPLPQWAQAFTATPVKPETMAGENHPELTVGIKIEHHHSDIMPRIHSHSHTAPPLATQISTQLQQQISTADKQRIELRLDPPELGRVTVHLTTHDQTVTALVSADRADTADLMRRHAELLTATLEKAGFSQANLSFQQGRADQGQKNAGGFTSFNFTSESPENTELSVQTTRLDGRLDIRL